MQLNFNQTTGVISAEDGTIVTHGWSGNHDGKNNPDKQEIPCLGPLPRGTYAIQPWEAHHDHLGPMVAFLKPDPANEMFGRGDFFIHGPANDPTKYGQESKGCIVVPREGRQAVKDLDPDTMVVII